MSTTLIVGGDLADGMKMSLTSHIRKPHSPIGRFFREQFPNCRAVQRGCRGKFAKTLTVVPPVRLGTIGNAIDYRLRYYFDVTPVGNLVAFRGATMLHDGSPFGTELWVEYRRAVGMLPPDFPRTRQSLVREELRHKGEAGPDIEVEFFVHLSRLLEQIEPAGTRLNRSHEELLARYCFVLALYEQQYRMNATLPREMWNRNSPLVQSNPRNVVELLELATDAEVDDLRELSWAFYDRFNELLTRQVVLNPKFDGSRDVGGADGDLIVDRCLVDIKTRISPCVEMEFLYQLLGYALLDYSDRYGISEVSILFTRQNVMIQWSLDELICTMRNGDHRVLDELREGFRDVARSSARSVARSSQSAEADFTLNSGELHSPVPPHSPVGTVHR